MASARKEKWGRRLLFGILRLIRRKKDRGRKPRIDNASIKRLLIIRIDERVGNLLLTTPLIAELKSCLPGARIEILVAERFAQVLHLNPHLEASIAFNKRWLFTAPLRYFRLLRQLRLARYDAVVEASHDGQVSLSSVLLACYARSPVRIGHNDPNADLFLTHCVGSEPEKRHYIEDKVRLAQPFGARHHFRPMVYCIDTQNAEEMEGAAFVAAQRPAGGRVISLYPGSRKLDHRRPPELFCRLALDALRNAEAPPLKIILAWGPGEQLVAEGIAADINRDFPGRAAIAPPTTLRQLGSLIGSCDLFVSGNTGPMHQSVAIGTPTLAIFVKADPLRWGHHYGPHRVVSKEFPLVRQALEEFIAEWRDSRVRAT